MESDVSFRVVALVVLALGFGASGVLRRRADRTGGAVPRSADRKPVVVALAVAGAVFYGSLLSWLIHPPLVAWAGLRIPSSARWTGAVLMAAGMTAALWSLWHLGRNVTPTAVARSRAELVTSGPYRWVRHPLYSSMLLTVPGCALLAANALVLVGGLATVAVILFRTGREETELIERFGDRYIGYMERTGRILPRLRVRR